MLRMIYAQMNFIRWNIDDDDDNAAIMQAPRPNYCESFTRRLEQRVRLRANRFIWVSRIIIYEYLHHNIGECFHSKHE